jgi:hypothetical protein
MSRALTLVLPVFVALVIVCAVWLGIDRRPPEWDHANHLERAVLCAADLGAAKIRSLLERSSFYPPLVTCTAGALYRLLPSDALAGQITMWLFLGLGMLGTYLLGRRVGGDLVGGVAAVLFGTAPFVVFSALRFQLDLPLAAFVAVSLWALTTTDSFTRRTPALLTGMVFGLGLLTKASFPLYVLPAVIVSLRRFRQSGVLAHASHTLAVATIVALPWYGPRAFGILTQVGARAGRQAAESGHPDPLTWMGLSFYPTWIVPQLGVVTVLLMLAGLVVAVRRGQVGLVASVLVPFTLCALIQNKNLRYTLPILPAAAVVAGLAFGALGPRLRRGAGAVVAIGALLQVGATAFGVPPSPSILRGVPWLMASAPSTDDWRQREVLAVLMRESGGQAVVSVVPNSAYFSVSNFRYFAVRDGLPLRFVRAWDGDPLGVDLMVLKSGHQGPTWTAAKPQRINERFATDPYLARAFPVVAEFPLPDGSSATVRSRRVPPHPAPPGAIAEAVEAAVRRNAARFARDIDGLTVTLTWGADIARGRVERLVMSARSATLGEFARRDTATLRVRELRLVATDLLVDPASVVALSRLDVLDVGRIAVEQATISNADLTVFLKGLKHFRRARLVLEDGAAHLALGQAGPDVTARIRIVPASDRPFAIKASDVRVAGVPIPGALVNWVIRNYDPTPRLAARLPVPVEIGDVVIRRDAVEIRPEKGAR